MARRLAFQVHEEEALWVKESAAQAKSTVPAFLRTALAAELSSISFDFVATLPEERHKASVQVTLPMAQRLYKLASDEGLSWIDYAVKHFDANITPEEIHPEDTGLDSQPSKMMEFPLTTGQRDRFQGLLGDGGPSPSTLLRAAARLHIDQHPLRQTDHKARAYPILAIRLDGQLQKQVEQKVGAENVAALLRHVIRKRVSHTSMPHTTTAQPLLFQFRLAHNDAVRVALRIEASITESSMPAVARRAIRAFRSNITTTAEHSEFYVSSDTSRQHVEVGPEENARVRRLKVDYPNMSDGDLILQIVSTYLVERKRLEQTPDGWKAVGSVMKHQPTKRRVDFSADADLLKPFHELCRKLDVDHNVLVKQGIALLRAEAGSTCGGQNHARIAFVHHVTDSQAPAGRVSLDESSYANVVALQNQFHRRMKSGGTAVATQNAVVCNAINRVVAHYCFLEQTSGVELLAPEPLPPEFAGPVVTTLPAVLATPE